VFPNFVGIKKRDLEGIDENALLEAREEARSGELVFFVTLLNSEYTPQVVYHVQYWAHIPGKYDHIRFTYGFRAGWDDEYAFLLSTPPGSRTANEIGFKGAWARG